MVMVQQQVPHGTTTAGDVPNTAPYFNALRTAGLSIHDAATRVVELNRTMSHNDIAAFVPRYEALIAAGYSDSDALMHLRRPNALKMSPTSLVHAIKHEGLAGANRRHNAHCPCCSGRNIN